MPWVCFGVCTYLAEHEGVEDDRVQNSCGVRTIEIEKRFAYEVESPQDDQLVNALTCNVPPHGFGDEACGSSDWWTFH